jgi:hypothetical protein
MHFRLEPHDTIVGAVVGDGNGVECGGLHVCILAAF